MAGYIIHLALVKLPIIVLINASEHRDQCRRIDFKASVVELPVAILRLS